MTDNSKDVIVAVLGASVALAGLLLIFSGLLFSQAAAFPRATTDNAIINRFRRAGRSAMWPFLLSLVIAGDSLLWLLHPGDIVYRVAWISFFVLLIATAGYGFWVAWRLL
jgi:hypothetical protein